MRCFFVLLILLAGCTSVVPTTAMRLNNLSPTTADPADVAVALTLPEGIDVQPGSAILAFAVTRSDLDQTAEGTFTLVREGDIYAISPSDHATLRALQATARQWDAENANATEGSLAITLAPCLQGAGPSDDARVNVGIRLAQDGDFLPLVRNGHLSAVTSVEQLGDIPQCDAAS
ncbi:hypothetical protein SLH49_01935 [Cognatiyoonia sp. IB215446]|uniref:hypothetical protein n=1 Tax=Cognatiyoonia sp. IB215446 TaxID=3097355 RepID=UPI002A146B3B|nr:hypothetical protein [Cognatiyoonia sp. IB215446]MDX8346734.1 hypothetical protein [Cognatiyoonia sp. IB215446]